MLSHPGIMQSSQVNDKTRLTRMPERQVTDTDALHDLLDGALVAHVGIIRDGACVVLPMGYARDGHSLLLHGSTGGGLLRAAEKGEPVTVSVAIMDGLVFARSLFDSSMNYRSAMVRGRAVPLVGSDKLAALRTLSEHLMPGRWSEVRPPTARELAATLVLRVPLSEVSLKVRTGGPTPDSEPRSVWAGVLPLQIRSTLPIPSPDNAAGTSTPQSVLRLTSS